MYVYVETWALSCGKGIPVWNRVLLPELIRRPELIKRTVWEFPMEALTKGSGSCITVGIVAVCYKKETNVLNTGVSLYHACGVYSYKEFKSFIGIS